MHYAVLAFVFGLHSAAHLGLLGEFSLSAAGFSQTTVSDPRVGLPDKYQLQDVKARGDLFHFETAMTTSCDLLLFSRPVQTMQQYIIFDLEIAESQPKGS